MDPTYHSDPAPFLPFIVERLFSTFLAIRNDMSVSVYPMEELESFVMTPMEHQFVQAMKPFVDCADASGEFPSDLRKMQELACQFSVLFGKFYFETNAHPHTAKLINSAS